MEAGQEGVRRYTNSAEAAARFLGLLSSSGPLSKRYQSDWAAERAATRVSAARFLGDYRADIFRSLPPLGRPPERS